MLARTLVNIPLAGFCTFVLCGCTRNNQLMIRPADGTMTYCSPLDRTPAQSSSNTQNEHCIDALEALGFIKAENLGLAGGGGFYLTDDGRVLSSEELTALSPNIPPQNRSFPSKGSGLKAGDVIIAIDGVRAQTRSEIVPHLIGKPGKQVTVMIRRNNIEQDLTMPFKPWAEGEGDVFYDQKFFFHFEYADKVMLERR